MVAHGWFVIGPSKPDAFGLLHFYILTPLGLAWGVHWRNIC